MKKIIWLTVLVLLYISDLYSEIKLIEDVKNWDKVISNESNEIYPRVIQIDNDNNIYIAGYGKNLYSKNSGYDWFIKKYNSLGDEIEGWNKVFDGNSGNDILQSLIIDHEEDVYVEGYSQNLVSEDSGYDLWIKKFKKSGDEIDDNWNKKVILNNTSPSPVKNGLVVDSNNNLYVTTSTNELYNNELQRNHWLIKKYDTYGNEDTENWNKIVNSNPGYNWPLSISVDRNNNIYLTGIGDNISKTSNDLQSNYDWWIKRFSSDGVEDIVQWNKAIDGNKSWDWAYNIIPDRSGNIYICGTGSNLISETSSYDWRIKKFDQNGLEITKNWNKVFGRDIYQDNLYTAILDSNDNLILGGTIFSDSNNTESGRIKYISADGKYNKDILEFTSNNDENISIWTMDIDSESYLYVLGSIFKYSEDESYSKIFIKKYKFIDDK